MYRENDYLDYGYTKKCKPTSISLEDAIESYNTMRGMGQLEVMEAKLSRLCEIVECILENNLEKDAAQSILDTVLMGGQFKIGDIPDELN